MLNHESRLKALRVKTHIIKSVVLAMIMICPPVSKRAGNGSVHMINKQDHMINKQGMHDLP